MIKNENKQRVSITKENFSKLSETVKSQKSSKLDDDMPMSTYVCAGCNTKYFDMNLYFYDTVSIKCMWCTKFPKQKERRA